MQENHLFLVNSSVRRNKNQKENMCELFSFAVICILIRCYVPQIDVLNAHVKQHNTVELSRIESCVNKYSKELYSNSVRI